MESKQGRRYRLVLSFLPNAEAPGGVLVEDRKGVKQRMLLGLFSRLTGVWSGIRARLSNEDGVLATEYVILLVLVALAIIVGATALGVSINNKLQAASTCVTNLSQSC